MSGFDTAGTKKLLIVDDSPQIQTLLRHVFGELGYQAAAMGGDADVRQAVKSLRPDLLLMSVRVGEHSGIRLCEALIEDPSLPELPVIFMAHSAKVSVVQAAMQVGAAGFFTKPLEVDALSARVDDVLGSPLRLSHGVVAA